MIAEPVVLRSQLLRAIHGFPTRSGGCSVGAYASLNCGRGVGDEPTRVDRNLEILARRAGLRSASELRTVHQVHGACAVRASPSSDSVPADALWTDTHGMAVGVRSADCLPILIEDRRSSRVCAVHAGWKGVLFGVFGSAVEALLGAGSRAEDLVVAIGPHIRACCFEVAPNLGLRFAETQGVEVVPRPAHVDLSAAIRKQAQMLGIRTEQIDDLTACTACDARFFSHRRQSGQTGRHLSFICAPAARANS